MNTTNATVKNVKPEQRFNIKSCVKSLFGTVSMEMRRNITRGIGEEQHQEPNAETDHPDVQHLQGYPP
ncbi:hypothetical protein EMCRGX_G009367 [Ephydatia muelleri]